MRMPEYYSCISLELFMLNCFRLLPPVPPPARSSPAHRSAVWYCWSMRALASLRRCCMLALWASNPSCLNIVGTYRTSRSHLFSAPSTLAKPNPLTMKSQAEGKKKYLLPRKQCFLLLGKQVGRFTASMGLGCVCILRPVVSLLLRKYIQSHL